MDGCLPANANSPVEEQAPDSAPQEEELVHTSLLVPVSGLASLSAPSRSTAEEPARRGTDTLSVHSSGVPLLSVLPGGEESVPLSAVHSAKRSLVFKDCHWAVGEGYQKHEGRQREQRDQKNKGGAEEAEEAHVRWEVHSLSPSSNRKEDQPAKGNATTHTQILRLVFSGDKARLEHILMGLMWPVNEVVDSGTGDTALHMAAGAGLRPIAKVLLRFGADPSIANRAGQTPAEKAYRAGFRALGDMLTGRVPPLGHRQWALEVPSHNKSTDPAWVKQGGSKLDPQKVKDDLQKVADPAWVKQGGSKLHPESFKARYLARLCGRAAERSDDKQSQSLCDLTNTTMERGPSVELDAYVKAHCEETEGPACAHVGAHTNRNNSTTYKKIKTSAVQQTNRNIGHHSSKTTSHITARTAIDKGPTALRSHDPNRHSGPVFPASQQHQFNRPTSVQNQFNRPASVQKQFNRPAESPPLQSRDPVFSFSTLAQDPNAAISCLTNSGLLVDTKHDPNAAISCLTSSGLLVDTKHDPNAAISCLTSSGLLVDTTAPYSTHQLTSSSPQHASSTTPHVTTEHVAFRSSQRDLMGDTWSASPTSMARQASQDRTTRRSLQKAISPKKPHSSTFRSMPSTSRQMDLNQMFLGSFNPASGRMHPCDDQDAVLQSRATTSRDHVTTSRDTDGAKMSAAKVLLQWASVRGALVRWRGYASAVQLRRQMLGQSAGKCLRDRGVRSMCLDCYARSYCSLHAELLEDIGRTRDFGVPLGGMVAMRGIARQLLLWGKEGLGPISSLFSRFAIVSERRWTTLVACTHAHWKGYVRTLKLLQQRCVLRAWTRLKRACASLASSREHMHVAGGQVRERRDKRLKARVMRGVRRVLVVQAAGEWAVKRRAKLVLCAALEWLRERAALRSRGETLRSKTRGWVCARVWAAWAKVVVVQSLAMYMHKTQMDERLRAHLREWCWVRPSGRVLVAYLWDKWRVLATLGRRRREQAARERAREHAWKGERVLMSRALHEWGVIGSVSVYARRAALVRAFRVLCSAVSLIRWPRVQAVCFSTGLLKARYFRALVRYKEQRAVWSERAFAAHAHLQCAVLRWAFGKLLARVATCRVMAMATEVGVHSTLRRAICTWKEAADTSVTAYVLMGRALETLALGVMLQRAGTMHLSDVLQKIRAQLQVEVSRRCIARWSDWVNRRGQKDVADEMAKRFGLRTALAAWATWLVYCRVQASASNSPQHATVDATVEVSTSQAGSVTSSSSSRSIQSHKSDQSHGSASRRSRANVRVAHALSYKVVHRYSLPGATGGVCDPSGAKLGMYRSDCSKSV